jgi:hypothetical protein
VEKFPYSSDKEKSQMPDKAHEFIEQLVEQRLKDIADELKNISIMLEGFKAAADKEQQLSTRLMGQIRQMQTAIGAPRYLSGRWPLRDGNVYGSVAPQPDVDTNTGPAVDGNDPTGNLRSTNVGGD